MKSTAIGRIYPDGRIEFFEETPNEYKWLLRYQVRIYEALNGSKSGPSRLGRGQG